MKCYFCARPMQLRDNLCGYCGAGQRFPSRRRQAAGTCCLLLTLLFFLICTGKTRQREQEQARQETLLYRSYGR